ncbi:MAG: toll/interleukin-1 receptor domain-containing protein [Vicinamibacterales bacterium]
MAQTHDAFISYSHAADRPVAAALERGMERLARPLFALRAMDVFRDATSLAASPGLWTGLQAHLEGSRWLVFVACPEAAASIWCDREVRAWLARNPSDRVLLALTAGELVWPPGAADYDWTRTTALPPAMRGVFREEPLYVDLRWTRQAAHLRPGDPRLRDAVLDLAAPVRGIAKDQLDGDDVRQLRRTRRLSRAAMALIVAAAAVAVWQAVEATRQRTVAERQRDLALSRQLAAQTAGLLTRDPRLAAGLAVQALATADTTEGATAVLRIVNAAPFERLVEQGESYWSLAVSDDGATAVVGDGGSGVQRIDLASGRVERFAPAGRPLGTPGTLAVAVARDGRIASGGFDQAITIRQDGRIVRTIGGPHEGFIMGLAFNPAGDRLASAGSDGRVVLHDLATGASTRLKDGWTPEATVVRFSPDGRTLAAGGDGGFRALFDMAPSTARAGGPDGPRDPDRPAAAVVEMRFSADGRRLVVAHRDGTVDVVAMPEGRRIGRVGGDAGIALESMAITPDAGRIVVGRADGAVVVWTGAPPSYGTPWQSVVVYRHAGAVKGVAHLARTNQIVSIGVDGRLVVSRPLHLGPLAQPVWQRPEPFSAVRFDGDAARVTFDGDVGPLVVDADGRLLAGASPGAAPGQDVLATRDGRTIRRGAEGGLSLADGERRVALETAGGSPAVAAAFAPDGRRAYTFHADGHLRAWTVADGAAAGDAAIVERPFVSHLAIDPAGAAAAVSIDPGIDFGGSGRRDPVTTVALVSLPALALQPGRLEAPGRAEIVGAPLFFTPGGRFLGLLTGAGLTLWQRPSGRRIEEPVVLAPQARMLGVVAAPDRLLLATRGQGGRGAALMAVPLSPAVWAAQACRLAGPGLSAEDWARHVGVEFPYRPACVDGVLVRGVAGAPGAAP